MKLAALSGCTLAPSGPNRTMPAPVSTKCSAIATISSVSTDASPIGRNTSRQISGPSGVTIASPSAIAKAGAVRGPSSAAAVTSAGYSTSHASTRGAGSPRSATTSAISAAAASASIAHSVPGIAPPSSAATVSVASASRSPWGTKITRVTEKTISSPTARSR